MRRKITSDELYSQFAAFYDGAATGGIITSPRLVYNRMEPLIEQSDKTVLDLACGSGLSGLPFHERGIKVTCMDSSADMLGLCLKKNYAYRIIRQELGVEETLPFSAGNFDIVSCNAGLHLMPNTGPLIDEMARVARRLIGVTYQPGDPLAVTENDAFRDRSGELQIIETYYEDPQSLRAAFARAGAELVSTQSTVAYTKGSGDEVRFNIDIFRKMSLTP